MPDYAPTWVFSGTPSAEILLDLVEIPGVRWRGNQLTLPDHARPIVLPLLKGTAGSWRVPIVQRPPKLSRELAKATAIDMTLEYQWEGILFAAKRLGSHLWWAGGAGKTLAACLWAACEPGPTVVVTKAAARGQYAAEVARFLNAGAFVIRPKNEYLKRDRWGSLPDYLADPVDGPPVVVVGWEALPTHIDALLKLRPTNLVFDEVHKAKSYRRTKAIVQKDGSARHVPAGNIVDAASRLAKGSKRRLTTTATPIKDRVRDLWGQLDLAEPWAWGGSMTFCKRYADARPGEFGGWDTNGSSNMDELRARTDFVAHRVGIARITAELPPKRREFIRIPYEALLAASIDARSDVHTSKREIPAQHTAARVRESASRKRGHIIEVIDAKMTASTKIVVFSGQHVDCDRLSDDIKKHFKGVQVWNAHGGNTTPSTRERVRVEYMEHPGPCILVGTGDAWGTAYNLQDTDVAIFGVIPWTGGDLHQWERRFARLKQTRPVVIVFLIAEGTIDEAIADNLQYDKLPAMERIVDDTETASAGEGLVGLHDRVAVAQKHLNKLREIAAAIGEKDE